MDKNKNLLILTEQFGQGGAEKVALLLFQIFSGSGNFNVYQCSLYPSLSNISTKDVDKIRSLNITRTNNFIKKIFYYYLKIKRLKKLKKDLSIDLTISSLWPTDWINILTGSEKKVAIIQINILNNYQNAKMIKYKYFVSYIYNKFNKIVTGNPYLIDELKNNFKVKEQLFAVIHNPIDCQLIDNNIKAPLQYDLYDLFEKFNVLIAANRLHKIKNTEALIYIYKKLHDKNHIKLLIIGEGEEESNIKNIAISEGLTYFDVNHSYIDFRANIFFLKYQDNMHNLISKAAIFLFPTTSEGFPLALLEAMYCKIPILVSDCPTGGTFEIMQGEGKYNTLKERTQAELTNAGYLMPVPRMEKPETIDLWCEKINELLSLDNSKLNEIKENNHKRAKCFDKEIIKHKWYELIENLF